jgi:hypothetical protein
MYSAAMHNVHSVVDEQAPLPFADDPGAARRSGDTAIVAEVEAAGLLTVGTDAQGRETWMLTPKGAQVATQMAMSHEDDAAAMLGALLDAAEG